jgi:hypothetical protein
VLDGRQYLPRPQADADIRRELANNSRRHRRIRVIDLQALRDSRQREPLTSRCGYDVEDRRALTPRSRAQRHAAAENLLPSEDALQQPEPPNCFALARARRRRERTCLATTLDGASCCRGAPAMAISRESTREDTNAGARFVLPDHGPLATVPAERGPRLPRRAPRFPRVAGWPNGGSTAGWRAVNPRGQRRRLRAAAFGGRSTVGSLVHSASFRPGPGGASRSEPLISTGPMG